MSRSGEFHVSVITVPGRGRGRGASERIKVAELSELALESCSKNTVRTYGSYMRLIAKGEPTVPGPDGKPYKGIGELLADEVRPSQLKVVYARAEKSAEARADRRESVGRVVRETTGSGAAFNAVGAWRCMFAFASDEQNVADGFNPALKVKKPARQKGLRTAIKEGHLGEMLELFASTGDDPELDSLIARFILITGARQEGVLNLRLLLMLLCGYQDPALQLGGTKGYSLAAPGPPRVCWVRGLRIAGFDPVR